MAVAAAESPSVNSKQTHDYTGKLRVQLNNAWIQHTQESFTSRIEKKRAARRIYVNKTLQEALNSHVDLRIRTKSRL